MEEPQFQHQPVNFLNPQPAYIPPEPPKKKPFLLYFFIIVLIILGTGCAYQRWSVGELPKDAASYDPITLKPKKIGFFQTVKNYIFHGNNYLQGEVDDRLNILLLGMGGPGHDGPYLTDTNIIVSIKPSSKEVAMISVPRDLGVNIPGSGTRKINYADAWGETQQKGQGGEYARQIFDKTFAIDIPYYIRVDFKAFVELIDEVGGLTIDVTNSFTDTMFPGENNSYITISFSKGPQTMSGERALQYARSRHGNNGEASDFARAKRQQQVLVALKEKLLSFGTYTNPVKVKSIMDSLTTHVTTNLDFGQLMYLASMAREINGGIKTLVLDNGNNGYVKSVIADTGAFLLVPKTGNFDEINLAIKNIFEKTEIKTAAPAPTENKPIFNTAKIEIQNGTWRVGLAAKNQRDLEIKGFTVTTIGNSSKRPIAKTQIYLLTPIDKEVISELEKEFSTKTSTTLPDWLQDSYTDPNTTSSVPGAKYKKENDILIILGEDAANQ